MTALVLDTGALVALERDDRRTWARLAVALREGASVQVPAGAVAQAWRDGRRQLRLVRALQHCHEVPLDGPRSRAAGLLCGSSGTADVIDASVAVLAATLARSGSTAVLTSDPSDIGTLLAHLDSTARVTPT